MITYTKFSELPDWLLKFALAPLSEEDSLTALREDSLMSTHGGNFFVVQPFSIEKDLVELPDIPEVWGVYNNHFYQYFITNNSGGPTFFFKLTEDEQEKSEKVHPSISLISKKVEQSIAARAEATPF